MGDKPWGRMESYKVKEVIRCGMAMVCDEVKMTARIADPRKRSHNRPTGIAATDALPGDMLNVWHGEVRLIVPIR